MTLIDDTCDGCGRRFDPMGDPHLTRRPEVGEWAVYCWPCSVDDRRAKWLASAETRWPEVGPDTLAAIYDEIGP